jgi:AcrR family transcriptional regulator
MVSHTNPTTQQRLPLSKDRILQAAIALADAQGIEALTMRNLAQDLDVEAMSLYYHVANKETLLDGVIDAIVQEIEAEAGGFVVAKGALDWKRALRSRILTARTVMLRHPWAPAVIETRTTMTATLLRYMDSLLGILIEGGFSNDQGHHAMHALGSRALGFNQELFVPADPEQTDGDAAAMLEDLAPQLPYLVAMLAEIVHDDPDSTLGWCDDQTEFEFGLDLILDGLDSHRLEGTKHDS